MASDWIHFLLASLFIAVPHVSTQIENKLPIGIYDFEVMVQKHKVFVDKTMFIFYAMRASYMVLLITRPRRFGKSIYLSMMRAFLDRRKSKDIFEKTKIFDHKDFCRDHQNKYPVIYLSFGNFRKRTYEGAMAYMRRKMASLFSEHDYLRESLIPLSLNDNTFRNIVSLNSTDEELEDSLKLLSELMYTATGVKPFIFIDEYDTALFKSFECGYFEEFLSFKSAFYSTALKENTNYEKAIVTGIAETAKNNIFSGLNHLLVDSVIDPIFPTAFGCTEDEVEELIRVVKSPLNIKDLRKMYDGYVIGGQRLYNPYSLVLSLANKAVKPYWQKSASMDIITDLISKAGPLELIDFRALLSNSSVSKPIYSDLVYSDISKDSVAFWTLLVQTGYLNAVFSHRDELYREIYNISIPNLEVKFALTLVESKFNTVPVAEVEAFYEFLETGNVEDHYQIVSDFFLKSGSFHEWGSATRERDYHIFLFGLFSLINRDHYEIYSNREEGTGRYDIAIIPRDVTKAAKIYEIKKAIKRKNMTASMQDAASKGVAQIFDRKYLNVFSNRGIKSVVVMGISFYKKLVGMNYTVIQDITSYNVSKLKFKFLHRPY